MGRANRDSPAPFLLMEDALDGSCYILCASGYAEAAVQEARMILSGQDLVPVFLGLKAGWIRSAAGGRVSAEVLLSQVNDGAGERPLPTGLLLAGGAECGQYLLADPRVHRLVQQMLAAECPVGLLRPVAYPLFDLLDKQASGSPILRQDLQTTADFINAFMQRFYEFRPVRGIAATAVA